MKEKMLIEMREKLQEAIISQEEYNKRIDRIQELLKNPDIREFVNLASLKMKEYKHCETTVDDMIRQIYILNRPKKNETNGIYIYIGTFVEEYNDEYGYYPMVTKEDNPKATSRCYWDIELDEKIEIPISEYKKFEKENFIIFLPTKGINKVDDKVSREHAHRAIQHEFFKEAILNSQESARMLILKKYNAK